MRSHGFRDRIFLQQHRDRTAGPALSRFCTIPADEHICPAAVQQGRKTRRACRSRASSCSRRAVSSVSSAGYRRRPSGSKTRTWRLSGPSGTRARASSILSSAAASGMASGRTGSRTMTCPGLPAPGESCTRAWRMQENCSSCRASSVSRSWRRATALSLAEHALSLQGQAPKKHGQQQEDERGHRNGGLPGTSCRPVALLNVAAVRHGQISPG